MKIKCLICDNSNNLKKFKWNNYEIYNCRYCELYFCPELVQTEGNSSPVHYKGMKMMENSFYKTEKIAFYYAKKRILQYEKILERKCQNILDIGCGPGVFHKPYKDLSIDWMGVEVSPFWIEFGKKNKIPILDKSLKEIEDKFDVITAHQVLEHVENPMKFMNQVLKILKPGGIFHLEIPNQLSLSSTIRKISPILSYDYGFIQPPMHMRAYSSNTIKQLFKKNQLIIRDIFTCSNNDLIWGQVREYSFLQKLFFNISALFGKGSLLIGIAKKTNV